jgi:hypothetical protein
MRHLIVGTAMLLAALIVTFAVASVLQSIGMSRSDTVAEPAVPEPPRPALGKPPRGDMRGAPVFRRTGG